MPPSSEDAHWSANEVAAASQTPGGGHTPPLDALYASYARHVRRWLQRFKITNPADLEDLVQEVFIAAMKQLPAFRGEARVSTWLYAITARTALRSRRNLGRRRAPETEQRHDGSPADPDVPIEADPDTRAAVHKVLRSLPEGTRALLVLSDLAGFSGEEIAAMSGRSSNSVWVALHRARRKFRAGFEPEARPPRARVRAE